MLTRMLLAKQGLLANQLNQTRTYFLSERVWYYFSIQINILVYHLRNNRKQLGVIHFVAYGIKKITESSQVQDKTDADLM